MFKHFITALAAVIPLTSAFVTPAMRYSSTNLENFADPAITKYGDTWYAFGTNDHVNNFQVATSTDFKTWTRLPGDALPTVGRWADQHTRQVWTPDVILNSYGKYIMYYSAKLPGLSRHCVGVGVANPPQGPYVPHDESLFCPIRQGGAIDATGYRDIDGTRYIAYKVDGNSIGRSGNCGNSLAPLAPTPILFQQVQPNGFTPVGAPTTLLDHDAADGPLVEAPSLTRTPDGTYVLFFSSNCFAGPWYDISYAVADHIRGPYVKAGPLAVTGTSGLSSPGGLDVAPDGRHVVFHANTNRGTRAMFTAVIGVDSRQRLVRTV